MMKKSHLKFVIVGHVDHGKSTLIGRLLFDTKSLPLDKIEEIEKFSKNLGKRTEFAFLLDHLQEEREQGLTIDTTQTFFRTPKREYVIIDAPGHVEFVKNMITGASQAEAAILIVDVKEGIKEQTRRHANVISMLGLEQVIVVLNKMDLVDYKKEIFKKVRKEAKKFLNLIDINPEYYIPVSALKGDNIAQKSKKMNWYEGPMVLEGLDSFKENPSLEEKPLIVPIQDVYRIGQKRISVGRIISGKIEENQKIKILPEGKITKVKSIEKFKEKPKKAIWGESIGITLKDPLFVERGYIICEPEKEPLVTDKFGANIFWMARENLKEGETIFLKCATQEVLATINEIKKKIDSSTLEIIEEDAKEVKNLEAAEVIIKTKRPIAIKKFNNLQSLGRFVLMKNENICAGGIMV